MNLWLDTETVGLQGPVKTVQFALDEGAVQIVYLFRDHPFPALELLPVIQALYDHNTVFIGFNVSFDLYKLYGLLHECVGLNPRSRSQTVAPFRCQTLDLQVHAMLKSPLAPFAFSRNRSRSIARVRRVPKVAMDTVAEQVTRELRPLIPEHFGLHLGVHRVEGHKDLVTLSWTVEGSLSLKGLMREYKIPTIVLAEVWPLPDRGAEKPWLPYPDPSVHDPVEAACEKVMRDPEALFHRYAALDVHYLRILYEKLGHPEPDHHSECAHAVAYTRYHGFDLDRRTLDLSIAFYAQQVAALETKFPDDMLKSAPRRLMALQALDPLVGASNKKVLTVLADSDRPSAALAADMLEYGPARQRLLQLQKVAESETGRAHPDLRVMGTATARMSGTAGMNWQGVGQAVWVDELLDQTKTETEETEDEDTELETELTRIEEKEQPKTRIGLRAALAASCVGDFSSFEVTIAASVYRDAQLQTDLDAGIDLHCSMVAIAHPEARRRGLSYSEIKARHEAHDPEIGKWRKSMKVITFGLFYFCSAQKIADTLNIGLKEAETVMENVYSRYPGIGEYRRATEKAFITADTERWDKNSVAKMATERKDMTGFRREWKFEAEIADLLWRLGGIGIKTGVGGSIVRQQEKGSQTIDQAVRSALLGSALAIQAAVCRQAGNMSIQATGANLCKMLMAQCWRGLHAPLMNIHDEIVFGKLPSGGMQRIKEIVMSFEQKYRSMVPSLHFDYHACENWADK